MKKFDQFTDWTVELQALAQTGLTYGHDKFDLERYQRIREIATEMMAEKTGLPVEKVKTLFCNDEGYPTPKIDTRAAIFKDNKILLVKESNGLWSLPGGWCEVNLTPQENCLKEVKEESGRDAKILRLLAVQDKTKHNHLRNAYNIETFFFICEELGGQFTANDETLAAEYFALDELPAMSKNRVNEEQVKMCFAAKDDPNWQVKAD